MHTRKGKLCARIKRMITNSKETFIIILKKNMAETSRIL